MNKEKQTNPWTAIFITLLVIFIGYQGYKYMEYQNRLNEDRMYTCYLRQQVGEDC